MTSTMLSRGEESSSSTSLSTLFLIQPKNLLAFFYVRILSWLMLSLLYTKNPRCFLKTCFLCCWCHLVILFQMQDFTFAFVDLCWFLFAFGLIYHLVRSQPEAHSMSMSYVVRVQLNQTRAPLLSSYGLIIQQSKLYATSVKMKTGTWTLEVYLWE